MSNLKTAFWAIAFFGLFFASCEKENFGESSLSETDESIADVIKTDITKIQPPTVVNVNGEKVLQFESYQHFESILKAISSMNREELDKWEQTMDFTSMRNEFDQAEETFNEIQSIRELNVFEEQYADRVYFLEEGDIDIPIGIYHVGSLVNKEGIVKIDNLLQKFTREEVITIIDGDYSKLSLAQRLDESNLSEKIHISPLTRQDARNGLTLLSRTSIWDADNERIKLSAEIIGWAAPNYFNQGGFPIHDGTHTVHAHLEIEAISQRKRFGIPFGQRTDIEVSRGANVIRDWNGNTDSFWMPLDLEEEDVSRLVATEEIHPDIIVLSILGPNVDYCFGNSAILGELEVGPSTRLWN